MTKSGPIALDDQKCVYISGFLKFWTYISEFLKFWSLPNLGGFKSLFK